jgi:hypothetical protein
MASTSGAGQELMQDAAQEELMPTFLNAFLTVTREPRDASGRRMTDPETFELWRRVNEKLESDPESAKEHMFEWLCRVAHKEAETLRSQMQSAVDEDERMATESLRDQVQCIPADSPWLEVLRGAASVILAQHEAARAAVRGAMQLLLDRWKACTTDDWAEVQASLDAAVDAAVVAAGGQASEQLTNETRTFLQAYVLWLRRIGHGYCIARTVEDHEGRRWLRWPRALRVREGQDQWSLPHEDLRRMDAEVQQTLLRATAGLLLRNLPASAVIPEYFVDVIAFLAPHSAPDSAIDALVCNNAACSVVTKCLLMFGFDDQELTSVADRIQQHVCAAPVHPKDAVDILCILDSESLVSVCEKSLLEAPIARLLQHLLSNTSKRAWFEKGAGAARAARRYKRQGLLDAADAERVFPESVNTSAGPQFLARQRLD